MGCFPCPDGVLVEKLAKWLIQICKPWDKLSNMIYHSQEPLKLSNILGGWKLGYSFRLVWINMDALAINQVS
jgi:hypothetical protein